jgi:Fur family transcriptional regulator, ferric uptake regulator
MMKAARPDRPGIEAFAEYLRANSQRSTRTRQWIFEAVLASPDAHPNASEIHEKLKARGKNVSLATIYRTLALLVRSGMVRQIDLGEDHSHYEPKGPKDDHGHFICRLCGAVMEFSDDSLRAAIERVGRGKAFELETFSIQGFGICERCRM